MFVASCVAYEPSRHEFALTLSLKCGYGCRSVWGASFMLPTCHSRALMSQVRKFIEGLAAGAVVADVGCGNGKYFMVRQDIAVLGSDRSSGLAQVAATRLAAGTAAAAGNACLLTACNTTPLIQPTGHILHTLWLCCCMPALCVASLQASMCNSHTRPSL